MPYSQRLCLLIPMFKGKRLFFAEKYQARLTYRRDAASIHAASMLKRAALKKNQF